MEGYVLLLASFITFSSFFSSFSLSHSAPDTDPEECPPSSPCGNIGNISYPFWSEQSRPLHCGRHGFQLNCPQDEHAFPSIKIDSQTFNVTWIEPSTHKMTLVRTDFVYNNCSSTFTNTSVSSPLHLFHYDEAAHVKNVTLLYDCPPEYPIEKLKFPCQPRTGSNPNSINYAIYTEDVEMEPLLQDLINHCEHHIRVPVSMDTHSQDFQDALGKGFPVQYNLDDSSGMRLFPSFSHFLSSHSLHSLLAKFILSYAALEL